MSSGVLSSRGGPGKAWTSALLVSCVAAAVALCSGAPRSAQAQPAGQPDEPAAAPGGEGAEQGAAGQGSGEPSAQPAAPPDDPKLELAKGLFKQANEVRRAGDVARALELYMKSRALVPSVPNTWNAALCLGILGRPDEALDLYLTLLETFRTELSQHDLEMIKGEMAKLRDQVGSLDVRANVEGTLVIDGRTRGVLPLWVPVRVMPGTRVVRVIKDGYETFEAAVNVTVGQTVTVDAKLKPLTTSGRLRIAAPHLTGAEVVVDGATVGTVPWEGTLAPGPHVYLVRRGDQGSAPRAATVLQGQTVSASADLEPLGPELRLRVVPATAELLIGGVVVGQGHWQGRLPLGSHTIEAREEGYLTKTQALPVTALSRGDMTLKLEADAEHPRWADDLDIWLEAMVGPALAPSLGSGAEASCESTSCEQESLGLGVMAGLRAGYEFDFKLSLEVAAAYMYLQRSFTRSWQEIKPLGPTGGTVPVQYVLEDHLHIHGLLVAGGVGYRLPLGEIMQLRAHALAGAFFSQARDQVAATASAGGLTVGAGLRGSEEFVSSVNFAVLPEIQLGARFGGWSVHGGLAMALLVLEGPTLPTSDVYPVETGGDCTADPPPVGCLPGSFFAQQEAAFGRTIVFVPSVTAGYTF